MASLILLREFLKRFVKGQVDEKARDYDEAGL